MKHPKRTNRYSRPLIVAGLLFSNLFPFAAPILAQTTGDPTGPKTTAGTTISNTATATYADSNDLNTTLGASSNTVTVTVAEVAGITITSAGVTNDTTPGGAFAAGNVLYFEYIITNVGNDPSTFVIPNQAAISGPGTITGALQVNQGTGFTAISGSSLTTGSVVPGGTIRVRVPVTVDAGATSGNIVVTLGNTVADNAQNVPYVASGGSVYTQDNSDTSGISGEVNGVPVNGEREASIAQTAAVNATAQAFAAVYKTLNNYNDQSTSATNDDRLIYELGVEVKGTAPTGSTGVAAAPLVGTANITVNSSARTLILVSDAIPANTDLQAPATAPLGWLAVYTTDALTTTANSATWSTTPPGTLANVTRVGFVYVGATGGVTNALSSASPAIAAGTPVTNGFRFTVQTEAGFTNGGEIRNIAQIFGQTQGGTTLVYDESGDQNPSNYGDNGNAGSQTPTDGVAGTANGTDPGNNNTGLDGNDPAGGEDNVFTIGAPSSFGVKIGPNGFPTATGPTGDNDDFTNKSTPLPVGIDTSANNNTTDPASIGFQNTARNTSGAAASISIIPNTALVNVATADLPANTIVRISTSVANVPQSRTYVWNGTAFLFDADGNPATTGDQSPIDTAAEVLTVSNVAAGGDVQYGVEIDLPAGTTLSPDRISTDDDGEPGYPVPVTAFIDTNTNGTPDTTEAQNTTIDRLYVGFLRMLKESRILQGTGPAVQGTDGTFSTTDKRPAPGNIIEYRVSYSNITTAASNGSNSVPLNATRIVVTENGTLNTAAIGTAPNGNSWAQDRDATGTPGAGIIDTSNVTGTAAESGGAAISFFSGASGATTAIDQSGTTQTTDVTAYRVDLGNSLLSPGTSRNFVFQRKVN
jgi:hypothetical protein